MGKAGVTFARLALCALAFVLLQAPAGRGGRGFTINPGVNRMKLDPQPDYEKTMKEGAEAKGASVQCTSGYRSPAEQLAACMKICGKRSCPSPNNCAPPNGSNHQKVATCDLKGIPGSAEAGCDFLFEMCQRMRSKDRSLNCEIGGYGPGGHHLAVGKGIRASAYNKCKHLKSRMSEDPPNFDETRRRGDDLEREIMGNNQPPPEQPPAQQPPSGTQPPQSPQVPAFPAAGNSSPTASYPTPYRSTATAPTPGSERNGTATRGGTGKGPIGIDIPEGGLDPNYSDVTKRNPGEKDGPSGITGGGDGMPAFQAFGGGAVGGGREGGGSGATGASKPLPASTGGFGGGGGFGASGSATGAGGKGKPGSFGAGGGATGGGGGGGSSEVLSSYAGGGGGGGKLGSSKVSVQGSEVASAVQSLAEEFPLDDRGPASAVQNAIGPPDSGTVFDRTRDAHLRCLRRGCVTSAR